MPIPTPSRLVIVALLGLAFGALAALVLVPGASKLLPAIASHPTGGPSPPVESAGKALVGGPFTLADAKGATVRDADFRGRFMLVFFGYTSCPDICPATLQVVSGALDRLGPRADGIAALFITLDPERDTPDKIGAYVASFSPRLIGLTGSPEAVAQAARAYRVYAKKVPGEAGAADYSFDHSSIVYLMGRDGAYLAHFTPATSVEQLAERLAVVLAGHG